MPCSRFLIRKFISFFLLFFWSWTISPASPKSPTFCYFLSLPTLCARVPLHHPYETTSQHPSIFGANFGPLTAWKSSRHPHKSIANCISHVRNNRFGFPHFLSNLWFLALFTFRTSKWRPKSPCACSASISDFRIFRNTHPVLRKNQQLELDEMPNDVSR